METGAITGYIDVAQVVLYVFWVFFFGLIYYLRREDKREGYPLESDRSSRVRVVGFPPMPAPKTFKLPHGGGTKTVPGVEPPPYELAARPVAKWPGAPLHPTGNPMVDGVGPAAWAQRAEKPDTTAHGEPRIVPMRVATEFSVSERDPDPRGLPVLGADGRQAGTVVDIWVDRGEPQIRYLEVEAFERRVLLPVNFMRVSRDNRSVRVASILAAQFADVPGTADPDLVTLREEDRICAYYGSGHLYAVPSRTEALL